MRRKTISLGYFGLVGKSASVSTLVFFLVWYWNSTPRIYLMALTVMTLVWTLATVAELFLVTYQKRLDRMSGKAEASGNKEQAEAYVEHMIPLDAQKRLIANIWIALSGIGFLVILFLVFSS